MTEFNNLLRKMEQFHMIFKTEIPLCAFRNKKTKI